MKFQKTRCPANRHRFEPRALDQNVFRRKGNFRFAAAHDSANTYGAGTVAIGNQADCGIKRSFDAIERFDFFLRLGTPYHNRMIAHQIVVKRMQRMPKFQHHVVCCVHHVVDRGHARGLQPLTQPGGRRLNLHISNYPRCEASAKFWSFNLD